MSESIIIPENLWEGDLEAVITNWFVNNQSEVAAGALIAEIMVEKVQYEITAPSSGVITITKKTDDIVKKGDTIGTIS